jgi:hypothetical protein
MRVCLCVCVCVCVCGLIFCACNLMVIFSFKIVQYIMHVLIARVSKAMELEDGKIQQM